MVLLLIVISCLQFALSRGFHFDKFSGTVTVGIPITISWHRDVNDTIFVKNFIILGLDAPFPISTNTTEPDGAINVTFPTTGLFTVAALDINTRVIATTQTFNVSPDVSPPIPIESVISSSSTESAQSTTSASPSSNLIHRKHKITIIIGAATGSMVFLLIIFGGGTFLFIRKRRCGKRNFTRRLSPNPKIIPEQNSHSPPVRNKNGETITPMQDGEMTPLGDRSWETVEQSQEGHSIEVERERRNSIGTPDTFESQSVPQQAALDIVAEVVRLRTQFQQFIVEREAERVQGNVLDPPPAYA